jgi:hypothetical protein
VDGAGDVDGVADGAAADGAAGAAGAADGGGVSVAGAGGVIAGDAGGAIVDAGGGVTVGGGGCGGVTGGAGKPQARLRSMWDSAAGSARPPRRPLRANTPLLLTQKCLLFFFGFVRNQTHERKLIRVALTSWETFTWTCVTNSRSTPKNAAAWR